MVGGPLIRMMLTQVRFSAGDTRANSVHSVSNSLTSVTALPIRSAPMVLQHGAHALRELSLSTVSTPCRPAETFLAFRQWSQFIRQLVKIRKMLKIPEGAQGFFLNNFSGTEHLRRDGPQPAALH